MRCKWRNAVVDIDQIEFENCGEVSAQIFWLTCCFITKRKLIDVAE